MNMIIVEIGYTHQQHASGRSWSSATSFDHDQEGADAAARDWITEFKALCEREGGKVVIDYVVIGDTIIEDSRATMPLYFYQDGAQFYSEKTGAVIADYSELFDYECDFTGALLASLAFKTEFPQYQQTPEF